MKKLLGVLVLALAVALFSGAGILNAAEETAENEDIKTISKIVEEGSDTEAKGEAGDVESAEQELTDEADPAENIKDMAEEKAE